jgi:cytochrome c1
MCGLPYIRVMVFNADKVGSPIIATMSKKGAEAWFGTTPPDLSLVARSKGTDWIYTYLLILSAPFAIFHIFPIFFFH